VITRNAIETVRGAPKCCWCGKSLRPQYATQRRAEKTEHCYGKQPRHIAAQFDQTRGKWVVVSTAHRVIDRKFQGAFGTYGDNLFCGLNCGRDYGVAVAQKIAAGEIQLLDGQGTAMDVNQLRRTTIARTASRRGGPHPTHL
jgi:hypothetical protein